MDADFALTPFNRIEIETLVDRLDCLPLAIELMAAQTEMLGVSALLERLNTGALDLLTRAPLAPVHAPDFVTTHALIQSELDEADFTSAYTIGAAMTPEAAVTLALESATEV